ncbi:hypothetical protein NL676_032376 [Syzygium grande]|nr:hypothetical protein NL676_032376 [Syzygium grande]
MTCPPRLSTAGARGVTEMPLSGLRPRRACGLTGINLSRKRNDPDDPNLTSSSSFRNRLHVELSTTRIRDPVPHESLPFGRQPYFAPPAGERCLDQWMRAVDVPATRRNMEMNGATTTRAEAVNDGNRGVDEFSKGGDIMQV